MTVGTGGTGTGQGAGCQIKLAGVSEISCIPL